MVRLMTRLIAVLSILAAGGYVSQEYVETIRTTWEVVQPHADKITACGEKCWHAIEANPVPVVIALAGFGVTFVYHWYKSRSFRSAIEVAATRVKVIEQVAEPLKMIEEKPDVVRRAETKLVVHQMKGEQIRLEDRSKKLLDLLVKAEKDLCWAEKEMHESARTHNEKSAAWQKAKKHLEGLRREQREGNEELQALAAEIPRLEQSI